MSAEDALREVLGNKVMADAVYFDCKRKHARLVKYLQD
jgi:hypothetical protein